MTVDKPAHLYIYVSPYDFLKNYSSNTLLIYFICLSSSTFMEDLVFGKIVGEGWGGGYYGVGATRSGRGRYEVGGGVASKLKSRLGYFQVL